MTTAESDGVVERLEGAMNVLLGRVDGLTAQVAALEAENRGLRARLSPVAVAPVVSDTAHLDRAADAGSGPVSRRRLLLGGAGAAAAGVGLALAGGAVGSDRADAAAGGNAILGVPNDAGTATTTINTAIGNGNPGFVVNNTGSGDAIEGYSQDKSGVLGSSSGSGYGVLGKSGSGVGVGAFGPTYGVYAESTGVGMYVLGGDEGIFAKGTWGVEGESVAAYGFGLRGRSEGDNGAGVSGWSRAGGVGVLGEADRTGSNGRGAGVYGAFQGGHGGAPAGAGVVGAAPGTYPGVVGLSGAAAGVSGLSDSGDGVLGQVTNTASSANAVHGTMAGNGVAGRFEITKTTNATAALYGATSGTGQGVKGNAASAGTGVVGTSASGLGGQFGGKRAAINLIPASTTGKPTTGVHRRGDLVVDNTGSMFLCTASGTPGTWVKVSVTPA
ncbi:MAG: hypothetical protein JWN46_3801 [Acidimicrobiales bacterium]|nr:hypothetical protein [Acidimicrobiales bacterium]